MPIDVTIREEDSVQDILGNPPGWLLHWGITCVFLGMGVLLLISWLVKYPDVIEAPASLTSLNPPVPVISKQTARIDELYYASGDSILQGAAVARLESMLEIENLPTLDSLLISLESIDQPTAYLDQDLPLDLELGQLQGDYADLLRLLHDLQDYLKEGAVFVKIKRLENEIMETEKLILSIGDQQELLEKDLELERKNYNRFLKLNQEGVTTDMELEDLESKLLLKEQQVKAFKTNKVNQQIKIEQLKTQISDLTSDRRIGLYAKIGALKNQTRIMQARITEWKDLHIIEAPIAGKISYAKIWSKDQHIKAGESICSIVPHARQGGKIIRVQLPVSGSGKIKSGNIVNVRFSAFPYQEYGVVQSQIKNLALLPTQINEENQAYIIEVPMPDTLLTTYGKVIPFRQEMQATAKIITEDKRILHRIFASFISIMRN